jgi:hypothetical protein
MPVYIHRQDKRGRGEQWLLHLGDSLITLVGPQGQVLLEWTPQHAANGVQFPSFSKSIKFVGFNIANVGMLQFAIDPATVKALRAFANRGIAARGPQAVRSVLHRAILTCAGGAALLCMGGIFLAITVYELSTGKSATIGNPHIVGFVTAISGLAILCRGIYGLYQYSQLKKLAERQNAAV